jgi:AcrR family transcriptional regulator
MLEAAARLLATRGYHGMSMRDLAAATGMSLANLYHYFPAKEDVLFALQTRAFDSLIAAAEEAVAAIENTDARLHGFILSHVRYVASHPDVLRVLIEEAGELPLERRRAVRRLKERYFRIGFELVRETVAAHGPGRRMDTADLERATYSIFGMLNWVYGWYRPARHGAPQAVARTIHDLALSGLIGRTPDRSVQTATERHVGRDAVRSLIHRRDGAA